MNISGLRRAGERAIVLDSGAPADAAAAIRELARIRDVSLVDVVPGAETVLVVGRDCAAVTAFLKVLPELAGGAATVSGPAGEDTVVEVQVRYDGPDLRTVAEATGLELREVIRRHSDVTYQAAFTGFAPGFAYLTGLDPTLKLPRRSNPRPKVPPGSVAIADAYSAVYPRSSPGGWHLLATTDALMFDPARKPPALISPGAYVRFVAERGPTP